MSLKAAFSRPPVLVALALALIAFLQSPGRTTFDTKLDLTVNPGGFLVRALHLWDSQGGLGQLQNQAFGYFFPIGPFFWMGHLLHIPPWMVQRVWSTLILVVAFEGARRLARATLGTSGFLALLAGVAYALGPRMLSTDGTISAEALVVGLVPWTVLPLVVVEQWGTRRAALLSALAVLLMGGANATLVFLVLPAPALWIVLREGRRLRLLVWWLSGVLLAVLWWLLPLLLLGRYSPPFLGWVESAANTTGPVGLSAAFRGMTDWVAYVSLGGHPYWPGASRLVTEPVLVAATGGLAVLGVVGLGTRELPHRRQLRGIAVVGLLLMVLGFAGSVQSPFAEQTRALLDGPFAPLRNVSKADPLLRLPLVLSLTFTLSRAVALRIPLLRGLTVVAVGLVLLSALPLLQGQGRPGPGFDAVPSWWKEAAAATANTPGWTLVLPGAGSGQQTWGRTIDEPLQPLARGRWVVRSQVPLGGAGSTRVLDAVEAVLAGGIGSEQLAALLGRSGIGRLLVRNDLDTDVADGLSPTLVHSALEGSPGLTRVAAFGPSVVPHGLLTYGRPQAYPEIELWAVAAPVAQDVRVMPLADVPVVSGGPESVLQLLESGVLGASTPTVLAGQAAGVPGQATAVITDGLRRRERTFGRVHQALGPVLTPGGGYALERAVHDLLPFAAAGHETTVRYDGIRDVTASSSTADVSGLDGADPSGLPYAAVDGNPFTSWRSVPLYGVKGQWLQVTLPRPADVPTVTLTLVQDRRLGPQVTRVAVVTDSGRSEHDVRATTDPQVLTLPAGTTTTKVRVTVVGTTEGDAGQVGITELALAGVVAGRTLVTASDAPPTSATTDFSFAVAPDLRGPCIRSLTATDCDTRLAATSDEPSVLDRTFTVRTGGFFDVRGSVKAQAGSGAAGLLEPLKGSAIVLATSSFGGSAAVGGRAALDGDPATAWVADPGDLSPALGLLLIRRQSLTSIRVLATTRPRASVPSRVFLHSPAGDRSVVLDADGRASFRPLLTDRVQVSFPALRAGSAALPVGVAELQLGGVAPFAFPPSSMTGAQCGFGPRLWLDGRDVPTRVVGTVGALVEGRPLDLGICGGAIALATGTHRVQVLASATFRPSSLTLSTTRARPAPPPDRSVLVDRWQPTSRRVTVGPGAASLLIVPENANLGWTAHLDGRLLTTSVVDGWQQAWVLPYGRGGVVDLDFTPDRSYRLSLVVGAIAALVLVLLCLVRRRQPDAVPAVVGWRSPPWLPAAGTVLLGAVLGGVVGVTVALLTGYVVWRLAQPWLVAGALGMLLTGVVVQGAAANNPIAAAGGSLSQVCGIALVAALAAAPLRWDRSSPATESSGS